MTTNVPDWACSGFTVALAVASYHASVRFADLLQLSDLWWLRGWEYWRDPGPYTVVSTGVLAFACLPLIHGVLRRSHASLALAGLVSASLIYALLLQVWSQKPGPIVDARAFLTMGMSLVPFYVSLLGVGGHALIAILEKTRKRSD